jgi:hypothetical protein
VGACTPTTLDAGVSGGSAPGNSAPANGRRPGVSILWIILIVILILALLGFFSRGRW